MRYALRPTSPAIPSVLQPPTVEHLQLARRLTALLRVLPDFLILGAQKAGTTSLFAYLSEHPRVAPALCKEVHFFDYNYQRGASWYRAHFPTRWTCWRRGLVTGEGSPYYLFHPRAPARAHEVMPQAKLIVLLRNPVERAYSHYQHQVRLGLEPLAFEDALAHEATRLTGEFEKLVADGEYYSFNYQNYSYLARGMYADQLSRWFRFFARAQFLILPSEPFYEHPAGTWERILAFLDLPAWEPPSFRVENQGNYEPMAAETRAWLADFFAPHNQRLYELLNVDYGWE